MAGQVATVAPVRRMRTSELHERAVERVIKAMKERLDAPLDLDEMAGIAHFSPFHFNRVFREVTGIPPAQFLNALRLEQAKRLLISTELSVTDLCFDVGYNSLGTFINRFHQLVGLSPSAFRAFAKEFSSFQLNLVRGALGAMQTPRLVQFAPWGTVRTLPGFDGLIFAGLFQREIPESEPAACTVMIEPGPYRLAAVPDGRYYVFSVGIPWTAEAWELLTLDGIARGRSDAVHVEKGRPRSATDITLSPKHVIHPPILAALPLLVVQRLAGAGGSFPEWCDRMLGI